MNQKTEFRKQVEQLDKELAEELKTRFTGFPKRLVVQVNDTKVQIGICPIVENGYDMELQSIVDIYTWSIFERKPRYHLNFGTSGSFTPSDKAPYWRTINAAIILQNWTDITNLCGEYCRQLRELRKIEQENETI